MELLLTKFLGLLDEEIDLYGSLLSILQKEKNAVVDSSLEKLIESSKEKENLFLKIRILEEQRPVILEIRNCQSSFVSLVQSIQEINLANKALLNHSLELVRGSLSLLNDLMSSNQIYYRTGKMQLNDQSGKLLSGKI